MGSQFLALSLFILLLSFFIMLNAHSNWDDLRTQNVIRSLDFAFSMNAIGDEALPSFEPQQEDIVRPKKGHVFEVMEALFTAHLSDFMAQKDIGSERMQVEVGLPRMQKALGRIEKMDLEQETQGINNDAPLFLETLVSLIQAEENGARYRMDISLGIEAVDDVEAVKQGTQAIAEIGAQLASAGLPDDLFSLGLEKGKDQILVIAFRPIARAAITEDSL